MSNPYFLRVETIEESFVNTLFNNEGETNPSMSKNFW